MTFQCKKCDKQKTLLKFPFDPLYLFNKIGVKAIKQPITPNNTTLFNMLETTNKIVPNNINKILVISFLSLYISFFIFPSFV